MRTNRQRSSQQLPQQVPVPRPRPQRDTPEAGGQAGNDQAQARLQFVSGMRTWLGTQQTAQAALQGNARVARIRGVLSTVETETARFNSGQPFDAARLPAAPTAVAAAPAQPVAAMPELISAIRPFINALEGTIQQATVLPGATAPEGSQYTTEDWNTRLGVPQYRTQSDNLAPPEATCNVTTFAMVLERLGIGREQLIAAAERQVKLKWIDAQLRARRLTAARAAELRGNLALVTEELGFNAGAEWEQRVRRYLNAVQGDSEGYRRIRGEASVSEAQRAELTTAFRANAQLEDVLDFLLSMAGISRYTIVSNPNATLALIDGDRAADIATNSVLYGGTPWATLRDRTRETLQAGGAAAFSFRHKGTRSEGTHIVSIQRVEDDAFVVDDPYGVVRADYNPRTADDAYWHRDERGRLVQSRSTQKNEVNAFGDWTADSAQNLTDNERKGDTTRISRTLIERSLHYVSLYARPTPQGQTNGAPRAPTRR